jgi:hypothetical protein
MNMKAAKFKRKTATSYTSFKGGMLEITSKNNNPKLVYLVPMKNGKIII